VKVLVYDTGIGLDHALQLGRSLMDADDGRVYYYKEWHEPFPRAEDWADGWGFPEIVKIDDWGLVYGDVDYVVFTDSGFGSLNDLMRRAGKNVFGNSEPVERLELDRGYGKKKLEELGVPVTPYTPVEGLENIMRFLEEHRGEGPFYVKLETFRGNMETMRVESPEDFRVRIMQSGLGPLTDYISAIIEPEAAGVEVGLDCFFNGEEFVRPCLFTVEHKGHSTTGKWVWESIFDEFWLDRIEGFLRETGYHGNMSVEAFWDGSKLYVTDPTPRFPYPGSSLFPRSVGDYAGLIAGIADGTVVEFKPASTWAVEIGVYTDEPEYWRPLDFPGEEYLRGVGFRRAINVGGRIWAPPNEVLLATANGFGDTFREAWDNAVRVADSIHALSSYHGGHERRSIELHLEKLCSLGVCL